MRHFKALIFLFILFPAITQAQNCNEILSKLEDKYLNYELIEDDIESAISQCSKFSESSRVNFFRAALEVESENYALAIQYYLEARKYAEDFQSKYDIENNLGSSYQLSHENNLALKHYNNALKLAIQEDDESEILYARESIILVRAETGDLDALLKFEEFYTESKFVKGDCENLETYALLVGFYLENNHYSQAKKFIKNNPFPEAKIDDCVLQETMHYQNFADIAIHDKQLNLALTYLNKIELDSINSNTDKIEVYKRYISAHNALGNSKIANIYNDSLVNILENVLESNNKNNAEVIAETINKNETNSKLITNLIWSFLVGIILLLIVYGFYKRTKRQRNDAQLKLSQTKSQNSKIWAKYKSSQNQLTKLKQKLAENYELNQNQNTKKIISELAVHLNSDKLNSDEQFLRFQQGDFLFKLQKKAPFFNEQEISIIYLLKSNLSHKEIAEVLNKSEKSIDSYKYRVNKKTQQHLNTTIDSLIGTLS